MFNVEGALLTNESTLEDFDSGFGILGHKLVPLSKVPNGKRKHYAKQIPKFTNEESYSVWYPPLSSKELGTIAGARRKYLVGLVEGTYKVSLKNYPKGEPLYIWKVAEFIRRVN